MVVLSGREGENREGGASVTRLMEGGTLDGFGRLRKMNIDYVQFFIFLFLFSFLFIFFFFFFYFDLSF